MMVFFEFPKNTKRAKITESEGRWVVGIDINSELEETPAGYSHEYSDQITECSTLPKRPKTGAERTALCRARKKEIAENVTGNVTKSAESVTNVTESVTNVTESVTNVTESVTNVTESVTNVTESVTNVTESVTNVTHSDCLTDSNINNNINLNNNQSNKQESTRCNENATPSNTSCCEAFKIALDEKHPLPEILNTPEIRQNWKEWIKYRRARGTRNIAESVLEENFKILEEAQRIGGEKAVIQTLEYGITEGRLNCLVLPKDVYRYPVIQDKEASPNFDAGPDNSPEEDAEAREMIRNFAENMRNHQSIPL